MARSPRGVSYNSTSVVVIGLLCLGPLALPLVWFNPRYKVLSKVIVTVLVIAATIWLCWAMEKMYEDLMKQLDELFKI